MIFSQQRGSEDTLFWKTQANNVETQAKSVKTQAYRQLWLFMVVENGRKNKPALNAQNFENVEFGKMCYFEAH